MPHYSVFVTLYVTEEVEADNMDAARAATEQKYHLAEVDYSVDDVILTEEYVDESTT